jgi:hypothetical protein
MGHKKHGHCSHALEEDAPTVWAWFHLQVGRSGLQSGGHHDLDRYLQNGGNEILPRN